MEEQSIMLHFFYLVFFSLILLGALLILKSTKANILKNKERGFYRIKFYNLLSKYVIFLTSISIIYSIFSILRLAFFS